MEILLSVIILFMIIGAMYALHAKDLLSALISCGIVGYSLVICFLILKAPDLAIVQIVVETITLIFMIAIVLNSTREEVKKQLTKRAMINMGIALAVTIVLAISFYMATETLDPLGSHSTRMSTAYIQGAEKTGSANLVTSVLFDFRGYDTLGEATILFTAVIGVLTVLRLKGRK